MSVFHDECSVCGALNHALADETCGCARCARCNKSFKRFWRDLENGLDTDCVMTVAPSDELAFEYDDEPRCRECWDALAEELAAELARQQAQRVDYGWRDGRPETMQEYLDDRIRQALDIVELGGFAKAASRFQELADKMRDEAELGVRASFSVDSRLVDDLRSTQKEASDDCHRTEPTAEETDNG